MIKVMAVFALVLVSACAGAPQGEQPNEAMTPPGGAVAAQFDPSCPTDPACVCTMPEDQRPDFIPTPENLRQQFPWMPKEIPNDCETNSSGQ